MVNDREMKDKKVVITKNIDEQTGQTIENGKTVRKYRSRWGGTEQTDQITKDNKKAEIRHHQWVAAYARVSAITAQTRHSVQAQEDYYRNKIAENPEWEFAGVYTDIGKSGTGMEKREAFQRLLQDCEEGMIDIILVKSVSRFARNTVDLLQTIRHLKELGISVRFEEPALDSLTEEGELLLTLAASVAQAESESISENIKWSIRKSFEKGRGNTRHRTFGYRWEQERLVVIPEEAEVVRKMYQDFLTGKSHSQTARELTAKGICTIHGNPFSSCAIGYILRNITYTGNLLLQKTYVQDPFTRKKIFNHGELPQYLVENDHEAIIDMETFQRVQERLKK